MVDRKRLLALAGVVTVVWLLAARRRQRRWTTIHVDRPARPDHPEEDADRPADLETIDGIGPAYAGRLRDAGVETVSDLLRADADRLAAETDIAEARIRGWIDAAGDRAAS